MRYFNEELYEFLTQFTVFTTLEKHEMEPIVEIAGSKKYETGTMIFMQDEPMTDVYFIQEGKINIYKTDYEGKEQIVNVLQKDDMFPHQGFFRKGNYPAHAEVLEEAILVNIPILSFENFLLTHPEISIKMFRVLSDMIIDLQSRLKEKMMYTMYDQILLLLLRLAKKNGEKINEHEYRITIQFTNSQLANMIGTSRETISRTLTQLRKEEIIFTDQQGFLVINYTCVKEKVLEQ